MPTHLFHHSSGSPASLFRPARRFQPAGTAAVLAALLLCQGAALPLRAQVTLDVIDRADNAGGSPLPLQSLYEAAVSGGHAAYVADEREGQFDSRRVIRLDGGTMVRSGISPAPGTDSTFSGLDPDVFVNAAGRIAFKANTRDSSDFGFWAGPPGALGLVALHGGSAPGTNGTFDLGSPGFSPGQILGFNDAGQVAFAAMIQGAPNDSNQGLWMGAPGAVQLVARTGSQAPGFANGVTWNYLHGMQLNASGQVAVFGRVSEAPPVESGQIDGDVLMVGTPGALKVLARRGQPAPDAEPFMALSMSSTDFALSAAGEVAFRAGIESGIFGITPSSQAIYAGKPGAVRLVARGGYPLPGAEAGAVFAEFDKPVINAAGEVAFTSSVARIAAKAVCVGRPGRLRVVARTDDVAPGTGGQLFGDFKQYCLFLSDSGQVAFLATFSPGGGLYGNNATTGLFATDKTGALHLIAREGIPVGGGQKVTLLQLAGDTNLAGSGDGRRTCLDAQGRLVFSTQEFTPAESQQRFINRAVFAEAAPVILPVNQPAPVAGRVGGSARFEVTAHGTRPATYQWRRDGVNLPGATGPALSLASLTTADRGAYTVVVTNALGSTTSVPAPLSFPPVIAAEPQDINVNAGTAAGLGVSAAGPGTLAYQWQYKVAGAAAFANVPGAVSASLPLPGLAQNQAGRYRVAVTNADGTTLSREAVVTVAAAGAPLITRILISGDPVTGISDTQFFSRSEDAVLNNFGEIAFEGNVDNDSSGARLGTYFRSAEGDYRFVTWQAHSINLSDSGELAQINSRPITTIEHGFPENTLPLARRNTQAPDGAGSYNIDGSYALAADGTAAFRFSTHLGSGAFIGKPGAVSVLGIGGRAAPGMPAGVLFDYVMDPVINPSGTAAFFATLRGPGLTEDNNTSLWKGTAAGVQRIVASGDPVPAAGSGVVVGAIRFPDSSESPFGWNDAGQVAFETTLAGTGVTGDNDRAILAGSPGALAVAAHEGLANGYHFSFPRASFPLLNRTGQVAFVATVNPTCTQQYLESAWLWTPGANGGTRQLIAIEGQQAPGLPAGIVFDSVELSLPYFTMALNGSGQIALMTRIAGPGISFDEQNDIALYLATPSGELKLVARTGGPIDLGGGQTRDLRYLDLALRSGGEDGRPRSFSEAGDLLFSGSLRKPDDTFALDDGLFTARLAGSAAPSLLPAYTAWAATAFPPGTPAALTEPEADADGDGIPNAIEYLTGTDPRTPSPSPATIAELPDGSIHVTFPRRPGVPDGLEIIETSPDLGGHWTPVPRRNITRTANGPGQPDTITVTLPAGADSGYVRLRVEF